MPVVLMNPVIFCSPTDLHFVQCCILTLDANSRVRILGQDIFYCHGKQHEKSDPRPVRCLGLESRLVF